MSEKQENRPGFIVILIDEGRGRVQATMPELEGCHAEGSTRETALENARLAIRGHLDTKGTAPRRKMWFETIRVNVPRRHKA